MSRKRQRQRARARAAKQTGNAQLMAYFSLSGLPPRTDLSKAHHARERPSQGGILSRMRRGEL